MLEFIKEQNRLPQIPAFLEVIFQREGKAINKKLTVPGWALWGWQAGKVRGLTDLGAAKQDGWVVLSR